MKRILFLLLMACAGFPAFAQFPALHTAPDRADDTIVLTLPGEGAWPGSGRLPC
ncbi:hypothetical protein [Hymenobacter lapidiphilus]|uniref:hypothetical protein n=1 Tax=Hymenobacter sp. CCM 8763 TaxID=2303334 RepID=UPI00167D07F9|nr:hypothetical protein [Hymenobacter sp. CCM 8763]